MNTATANRTKRTRWITFDLDMKNIIQDYARRYVETGYENETLEDAANQVALDLKTNEAKIWFKDAVKAIRNHAR